MTRVVLADNGTMKMTCKQLNEQLDDFLDGHLDPAARAEHERHIADCDSCRKTVDDARQLQVLLHDYGATDVSVPDTAFFDRAILKAAHAGSMRQRNQYWLKGFGSAVAAGLALFAVTLMFLKSPEMPDAAGGPGVTMSLEQPQTINLVFASASELIDATLTVVLPDGVDVAGFEGQREITWVTSLKAGKNVLPLQLVATSPRGGELLATLHHRDDDRTFRLTVNVI